MGRLPRHIRLSNFEVALERGSAGRLQPVVQGLRLHISHNGLAALAAELVAEADRRAPVGIALKEARVGPGGVDLVVRVEKSIFRGDVSTRLALSAPGGELLRVELRDTNVPAWVPLDLLLDEAVKRSGGAVRRDPSNRSALLLDPAALLTRAGVPGRFAPGRWDVTTDAEGIDLAFGEGTPGA